MDAAREAPATFAGLLEGALRDNPGRPLVTAYDDATGERTELSVLTYANWVAKTANLLTDEYLLDDTDTVLVDLPTHWLAPVFLGAAWSSGVALTTDPTVPAHLVVCGPDHAAYAAAQAPVLACSLRPFAVRFPDPLPDGVDDFGALWPGQSDVFTPAPAPGPASVACRHSAGTHTQAELMELSATASWAGSRLITDLPPTSDCGASTFLASLLRGGSLVLVANPDDERWRAHRTSERATGELRLR
ncbi:MAG: TIGR03089 family protein [Marmoricola sp.]